jgi:DNA polymerase-3 subunit gamma/tau
MVCARDLLVFKMAGSESELIESSSLGKDGLETLESLFSQADLIRAFHSLADTSVRMRDANEPRYILEVGLLKLAEMGNVSKVEDIVARLTGLEKQLSRDDEQSPPISMAAAAESKKKV